MLFLKKGMTEKQAEGLLGKATMGWKVGQGDGWISVYLQHGMAVSYAGGKVDSVDVSRIVVERGR